MLHELLSQNTRIRNRYAGQRCIVIGNGPSLNQHDLLLLKDEVKIVVNSFHKHPALRELKPDFWVLSDPVYWEQPQQALVPILQSIMDAKLAINLLISERAVNIFRGIGHKIPLIQPFFYASDEYLMQLDNIDFSKEIPATSNNPLCIAIMLAIYLGCKEVCLIGWDHSWWEWDSASYEDIKSIHVKHYYAESNAWDNQVYAREWTFEHFQNKVLNQRKQYKSLYNYANTHGCNIVNATTAGCLDVFPRVAFDSILSGTQPLEVLSASRCIDGVDEKRSPAFQKMQGQMRRILLIWNFCVVPMTIGEFLYLLAMGQLLFKSRKSESIEVAFIISPTENRRSDHENKSYDQLFQLMKTLFPLLGIGFQPSKVLVFSHSQECAEYIRRSGEGYFDSIYPSRSELQTYYYTNTFNLIQSYYKQTGWSPCLHCGEYLSAWAKAFVAKKVLPRIMVTVQLRQNKLNDPRRNANIEAWLQFFSYAGIKWPEYVFMIFCGRDEMVPQIGQLKNIIYSKQLALTLDEELSLIDQSVFYMGGPTGILAYPYFSLNSYVGFNMTVIHERILPGEKPAFATEHQHWVWEKETCELLIHWFEKMAANVDTDAWRQKYVNHEVVESPYQLR